MHRFRFFEVSEDEITTQLEQRYTKLLFNSITLPDQLSDCVSKIGDRTIQGGFAVIRQVEANSGLINGALEVMGGLAAGNGETDTTFTAFDFEVQSQTVKLTGDLTIQSKPEFDSNMADNSDLI
jgi:hypothetical protein